jgi:hypothetical protein
LWSVTGQLNAAAATKQPAMMPFKKSSPSLIISPGIVSSFLFEKKHRMSCIVFSGAKWEELFSVSPAVSPNCCLSFWIRDHPQSSFSSSYNFVELHYH